MNETNHNQAAPAPATDEREAFEAVASDNGQWPKAIERDARGNYVLLTTANGWIWWRAARAALAATPPATEESSAVEVQAEPVAFKMVAAPVVPPEPVSTYIEVLECSDCGHIGINDADGSKAACNTCEWQGDSPIEDKCPGCNAVGTMTSACPKCGARTSLIAETNLLAGVSAPAGAVEPTDAELIALNAGECYFSESPSKYPELGHGTQYHAGAPGVLGFARAALALRADPAAYSQKFQQRVQPWMMACFGPEISADRIERNHRFLEEALELVQACGCSASEAHQLVDYVFGRPVGELVQEAGGAMVTLAALCLANGLDMHAAGETELARIWTKVEAIRAKQAAKPKHSPLPAAPAAPAVDASGAVPVVLGKKLFQFSSHQDWVNRAQRAWKTAGVRSEDTICLDQKGRVLRKGLEFARADKEGAFPVDVYLALVDDTAAHDAWLAAQAKEGGEAA